MTLHDDKPSSHNNFTNEQDRQPAPQKAKQSTLASAQSATRARRRKLSNKFFERPSNKPAIAFSALFLAIFAALALAFPFEPTVQLMTVALCSKNALTFLLTVVATLWGASAYFRCSDAVIKRYIFIIATLIVAWSIVSILKHITHNNYIESLLWYAYYLPITLVPTFILFCALHIVVPDNRPAANVFKMICLAISITLSILVLTNNIHQLAFEFSFDDELWRKQHTYGPVYFAIFGWTALQAACFLVLLFTSARKQLRNALAFIGGIALLGIAYSILYNLRIEPAYTTPITLIFSLFYIAIIDLCLRTGLFPSCSDYLQAFEKLPLDVKLQSIDKSQRKQTLTAKPTQGTLFSQALSVLQRQKEPASFKLANNPDEAFIAYSVLGGTAVVTKDIAALNQRKHDLEEQQVILRQQNALLEQYRLAQTQLHRKRSENKLFQNIETSLAEAVGYIKILLTSLESQIDQASPEKKQQQRRILMKVKLLVSYCKRKGGLVLVEHQSADFDRSRLNLMINETLSDLRPAGIDCAALIETDDVLPTSTTSIYCDCLYSFALTALDCKNPTIMLLLQNKNDSFVELRIVLEDEQATTAINSSAIQKLERTLKTSGATFTLNRDAKTISLSALMLRRM